MLQRGSSPKLQSLALLHPEVQDASQDAQALPFQNSENEHALRQNPVITQRLLL